MKNGEVDNGLDSLKTALDRLCDQASKAIEEGYSVIILSDRGVDERWAPIPSLLATGAVHHHLIREGTRTKAGLVVDSGEPREVHHFSLLIGYGAGAVHPYLALNTVRDLSISGELNGTKPDYAEKNFIKANEKGRAEGHVQDGDIHGAKLPGSPDFRSRRLGPRVD